MAIGEIARYEHFLFLPQCFQKWLLSRFIPQLVMVSGCLLHQSHIDMFFVFQIVQFNEE